MPPQTDPPSTAQPPAPTGRSVRRAIGWTLGSPVAAAALFHVAARLSQAASWTPPASLFLICPVLAAAGAAAGGLAIPRLRGAARVGIVIALACAGLVAFFFVAILIELAGVVLTRLR